MELPSVFLTWDWITTWISNFGQDYTLRVIFVYKEKKLVGILPLAQCTIRLAGELFKLNTITICGGIELYPDHLDLIHSQSVDVDLILENIFDFIFKNFKNWDIFYLPFLSKTGRLHAYIKAHHKHFLRNTIQSTAPVIQNEKNFNTYFQTLKRKKRYNLNRERKKLFLLKDIAIEKVNENTVPADLDKKLSELFRLHKLRARRKGIVSTFSGKRIYQFHRDIVHRFHQNGWLRLNFLSSQRQPVAAAYGFVFGGRYSYYQSGMDPAWEKLSPGKILIFEIIKEEFGRGTREFDFLGGQSSYKTFWANQSRHLSSVKLYNRNFKGIAACLSRRFCVTLKYFAHDLKGHFLVTASKK